MKEGVWTFRSWPYTLGGTSREGVTGYRSPGHSEDVQIETITSSCYAKNAMCFRGRRVAGLCSCITENPDQEQGDLAGSDAGHVCDLEQAVCTFWNPARAGSM